MKRMTRNRDNSQILSVDEMTQIRPYVRQGAMVGVAAGLVLALVMVWALMQLWPS